MKESSRCKKQRKQSLSVRRYGITLADQESMKKAQDGRCYICRRISKRLGVDHDHDTGLVRGMLCWKCNQGLTFFTDSARSLDRAVKYMDRAWEAWESLSIAEQELWWTYRGRVTGKGRAKRISATNKKPRLPLEYLLDVTA